MGYFIENKEIAKESKSPAIISLSGSPNYIQFESKEKETDEAYIKFSFYVNDTSATVTTIVFEELSGNESNTSSGVENPKIVFEGTLDKKEVSDTKFFVNTDKSITAQNIRECMLSNRFLRNNFQITIPPVNTNGKLTNGSTIIMQAISPGSKAAFRATLSSPFVKTSYSLESTTTVASKDTISLGASDTEIRLEIYRDTDIVLGLDDKPLSGGSLGTYTTTLTKAYSGQPIWFDLNALMGSHKVFSDEIINNPDGWKDAGTMTDFRFLASKSDGINTETFYVSNVLYTITGYQRELDVNDLTQYVYNTKINNYIKPLTHCTELTHIKGQSQYFNFILSDPDRNKDLGNGEYSLGLMYKLYTHSRILKKTIVNQEQSRKLFSEVNTIRLDIDSIIALEDDIAYVEVSLCRANQEISEPMKFTILPECLYSVRDFAFLNALGGWSSFNFGGASSSNFKAKANTFYKTQTPDYTINSQIESVYNKAIEEQQVAQTMPIDANMCEWLKELSSSVAVYELSTKRYVIVDELTIKPTSEDELFILDLKYHYSDTYNGVVK